MDNMPEFQETQVTETEIETEASVETEDSRKQRKKERIKAIYRAQVLGRQKAARQRGGSDDPLGYGGSGPVSKISAPGGGESLANTNAVLPVTGGWIPQP